mmetsp:Transcript_54930/g.139247  ORF Transcript_54930/g.139247 Transcript_54930/m.139247 type:complete len:207 (-) Transcript_54930:350-970(-)
MKKQALLLHQRERLHDRVNASFCGTSAAAARSCARRRDAVEEPPQAASPSVALGHLIILRRTCPARALEAIPFPESFPSFVFRQKQVRVVVAELLTLLDVAAGEDLDVTHSRVPRLLHVRHASVVEAAAHEAERRVEHVGLSSKGVGKHDALDVLVLALHTSIVQVHAGIPQLARHLYKLSLQPFTDGLRRIGCVQACIVCQGRHL